MAARIIDFSFDDWSPLNSAISVNFAHVDNKGNPTRFLAMLLDSMTAFSFTACIYDRKKYSADKFFGILIDTGCSRWNSGGLDQYCANCRHVEQDESIGQTKTAFCIFGISGTMSIGTATIEFPIQNIILKISVYIIETDLIILLSLEDMNVTKMHYNNLENKLYHVPSGHSVEISRKFNYSFLRWNSINHCFFTVAELRRFAQDVWKPKYWQIIQCPEALPAARRWLKIPPAFWGRYAQVRPMSALCTSTALLHIQLTRR